VTEHVWTAEDEEARLQDYRDHYRKMRKRYGPLAWKCPACGHRGIPFGGACAECGAEVPR